MSRIFRLIAIAAVLLTACATHTDSTSAGSTTVTLLTHDSFLLSDSVIAQLEANTGITLRIVKAGDAGTMVAGAVLTAGNPTADVLYGIDNTMLSKALSADVFEKYRTTHRVDLLKQFLAEDGGGYVTPVDFGDVCINYDKQWLAAHSLAAPATLADLVKPAYRNLLVIEDPAASSPGLAFMLATRAQFGDGWLDYWKQLQANGVKIDNGWEAAYYSDFTAGGGNGSYPLVVSYASSPAAEIVFAAGTPPDTTRTASMTNGCFRQIEYAGVLAGTSKQAAARTVVDWLVSKQVQSDIPLNMFVYPVRADVPVPAVFESLHRQWSLHLRWHRMT